MKRLQRLFLLLLALPIGMLAKDVNTLVVLTKDGGQHCFVLADDKPQVTFEGTDLKITCEKASASASFALADVIRFTYEAVDPTGINEQKAPKTAVSFDGGILVISQIKAGETVGIYSMDGCLQQQLKTQHAGTYRLPLASLPFGVYFVKTGTLTYKITKR